MTLPRGTTLFAAPADDDMIEAAKKYISEQGLTPEDVKLGKRDGQVLVETIREIW